MGRIRGKRKRGECPKCGGRGVYNVVKRGDTTSGSICNCPAGKRHPMRKATPFQAI